MNFTNFYYRSSASILSTTVHILYLCTSCTYGIMLFVIFHSPVSILLLPPFYTHAYHPFAPLFSPSSYSLAALSAFIFSFYCCFVFHNLFVLLLLSFPPSPYLLAAFFSAIFSSYWCFYLTPSLLVLLSSTIFSSY